MRFTPFYLRITASAILLLMIQFELTAQSVSQKGPFFATGIRIGDVSQNEAVIWTRLTKNPTRVNNAPLPIALYTDPETGKKHLRKTRRDKNGVVYFPQGFDINTIEGAVPGANGMVRVNYKKLEEEAWQSTTWQSVAPEANFSKKFILSELKPGTTYALKIEGRPKASSKISAQITGKFKTPPDANSSRKIVFAAST